MKKYLSPLDLFPVTLGLNVLGEGVYSTLYSSITSFLLMILYGFLFVYFGLELFLREQPRVVVENVIPLEHNKVPVTNQNFTIFFRLEDEETNPVNLPSTTLKLFYYEYIRNEQGLKLAVKKWSNPKPCTETTATQNPALSGFNLSNWLCVDWSDIQSKLEEEAVPTLGGNFEIDFFNYVSITLNSCEDALENENCSSAAQVEAELSARNYYIAVYHPTHYFDKDDSTEGLKINYVKTINSLSTNISKQDRLTFGKVFLSDDQNWVFNLPEEKEALGLLRSESVTQFRDSANFTKNVTLYNMWINFTKDEILYTRSYLKLQELLAQVGGVIALFSLFLGGILSKMNENMLKLEIAEKLFYFKDSSDSLFNSTKKYSWARSALLKALYCVGVPLKRDEQLERAKEYIDEKLDIFEYLKMRANVDFLNRVTLDERDSSFIEKNIKIVLGSQETADSYVVSDMVDKAKESRITKKDKELIQFMTEAQILKLNSQLEKEGLFIN